MLGFDRASLVLNWNKFLSVGKKTWNTVEELVLEEYSTKQVLQAVVLFPIQFKEWLAFKSWDSWVILFEGMWIFSFHVNDDSPWDAFQKKLKIA